jgi:site-specific DNA recombinase
MLFAAHSPLGKTSPSSPSLRTAAPRGRAWNASTINGWGTRGAGILNNPIYVGRIVWNKNRMVKNPDTGRRVSRANPESA